MALQSRQMLSFARRCSPCYGQLVGSHTASASATARPAGESPTSSAATASTSSPLGLADSWGSAWIARVRWASTGGEQPQDMVHDDFDAEALKPQCWKCGAAHCAGRGSMDPLKCGACKAVLPPPPNVEKCMFQLLGESPSFDIDVVRLEQRYKDMQREFHPDKFATASALEREYSAYYASLINEGYSMLRHPLHRARLLLKLLGKVSEEDEEGTVDVDPELLMETMEAREAVEEASEEAELLELQRGNVERQRECEAALSRAFGSGNYLEAKGLVQRLTYLARIGEEILRKL